MLSGIGPEAELKAHGIRTLADLPVGANLQDHLAVMIRWERNDPGPFRAQMRFDRMAVDMVRAWVKLRSADPHDRVRIAVNAFDDPEDLAELYEGYECAREVGYSSAMSAFRGRQLAPDPALDSRAATEDWIRRTAITAHHPAGTCAMGSGPGSVVDPALRVRGVERLRVVDASVIPDMPSAHINAVVFVFVIAEKASDLIRSATPAEVASEALSEA